MNDCSTLRYKMDEDKAKREAALEEKMRLIRKRNEERLKRMKEVEEDRANADLLSDQVAHKSPGNRMAVSPATGFQRGRGRQLSKMSKESLKAREMEERKRPGVNREGEQRRTSSGKGNITSSFLADDRRVDMGKNPRRSPHSYGGSHFDNAVSRMTKEKSHVKTWGQDASMTGKERLEYSQWKAERERIDADRRERQRKGEHWSREWDQTKEWNKGKATWSSGNSDRQRRNKKPAVGYEEDSWGEDTSEKVWDAKNRRWVDPQEAVSFDVTEQEEEDWCIEADQAKAQTSDGGRTKSPSEASGKGGSQKPQQTDHNKTGQPGNTSADDLRQKITASKETRSSVSGGMKGPSDGLVGETQVCDEVKVVDERAQPKPHRAKVTRRRGTNGKNTDAGDGGQHLEDNDATQEKQVEIEPQLVQDQNEHSADAKGCEGNNLQEFQDEDGEKSEEASNNDAALLGETQGDEWKPTEERKDSIDFVPYSPLDQPLPLDWGDVEIDEEQLALDTEIKMVTC